MKQGATQCYQAFLVFQFYFRRKLFSPKHFFALSLFAFLDVSCYAECSFFSPKIVLQWAVDKARRHTMLPSILVFPPSPTSKKSSSPIYRCLASQWGRKMKKTLTRVRTLYWMLCSVHIRSRVFRSGLLQDNETNLDIQRILGTNELVCKHNVLLFLELWVCLR